MDAAIEDNEGTRCAAARQMHQSGQLLRPSTRLSLNQHVAVGIGCLADGVPQSDGRFRLPGDFIQHARLKLSLERAVLGLQSGLLRGSRQQFAEQGRRTVGRNDVDIPRSVRARDLRGFPRAARAASPRFCFGCRQHSSADSGVIPGDVDEADLEWTLGQPLDGRRLIRGNVDLESGFARVRKHLEQEGGFAAAKQQPCGLRGRSLRCDYGHKNQSVEW